MFSSNNGYKMRVLSPSLGHWYGLVSFDQERVEAAVAKFKCDAADVLLELSWPNREVRVIGACPPLLATTPAHPSVAPPKTSYTKDQKEGSEDQEEAAKSGTVGEAEAGGEAAHHAARFLPPSAWSADLLLWALAVLSPLATLVTQAVADARSSGEPKAVLRGAVGEERAAAALREIERCIAATES
jgi:hypothetical protein